MSTTSEPAPFSILQYYKEQGLMWGTADMFAVGRAGSLSRLGEFAAILRSFARDNTAIVKTIILLWHRNESDGDVLRAVREQFDETFQTLHGELPADALDQAFSIVEIVDPNTLDVEAAVRNIREAQRNSAIVIAQAALYRASGVDSSSVGGGPWHTWVPHLHALASQAVAASKKTDSYVVLDAGEALPTETSLRDLLLSVEGCGVVAADTEGSEFVQSLLQRWHELAANGDLGVALAELSATDGFRERDRELLRLQLYNTAGFPNEVRSALVANPAITADLPPEAALEAARLAEVASLDDLAADLLYESLQSLRNCEQLELALSIAVSVGRQTLVRAVEAKLETVFPKSHGLRRYHAETLSKDGRYHEASALAAGDPAPEWRKLGEFWRFLGEQLTPGGPYDASAFIAAIEQRFPHRIDEARQAGAAKLEREGRRSDALALLMVAEPGKRRLNRHLSLTVLGMVQRGRLERDPTMSDDVVTRVITWVLESLARNPADGPTRVRLLRTISPQIVGDAGVGIMAAVALFFAARPASLSDRPPLGLLAKPCSPEALRSLLHRASDWLRANQIVVLGSRSLPPELLDVPADEALAGLREMAELLAGQVNEPGDLKALHLCLGLALAVAPLSSEPNEALGILRVVAGKLAQLGHVQQARDLAEHAMTLAGDDPTRARLAWVAYADVYERLGNNVEALVAMACAYAGHNEITWEQLWYESVLTLRIFRDLGLLELARPLLAPARAALERLGQEARYGSRIDTVELQIAVLEYTRSSTREPSQLSLLIDRATLNLKEVLAVGDEVAPAAALVASLAHLADVEQGPLLPDTDGVLTSALESLEPKSRALIEMVRTGNPTAEQVAAFARQIEPARYAEDVGYDLHKLVGLARRLLASENARNPVVAVYAIEVLANHAVTSASPIPLVGVRLIDSSTGPAQAARALATPDLSVVLIGLASDRLARVVVQNGELYETTIEAAGTFAEERLRTWLKTYPYGYVTARDNVFYTSTQGIGLSDLPPRAVVVASTDLQGFPPNLFQIRDSLAGWTRRLASAPSLSWLRASRAQEFLGDGRIVAWIPIAAPDESFATLATIAERLTGTFEAHSVILSTASSPPEGIGGADVAIVIAHGGVAEGNRFFRSVQDDFALVISSSSLARRLANVGTLILFVCSGGRLDKDPRASAVVGLANQLLDRGCRAVVAPPWPLEASVPPHWLPSFLDAWQSNACVIDACFAANIAVRTNLGDDPGRCLAMAVYGDPLVRRSRHEVDTVTTRPVQDAD